MSCDAVAMLASAVDMMLCVVIPQTRSQVDSAINHAH